MTTLEFLREALTEAEQRRDLHQARALFQKIQRETWRTVPRMPERLPERLPSRMALMSQIDELQTQLAVMSCELEWRRQVMA